MVEVSHRRKKWIRKQVTAKEGSLELRGRKGEIAHTHEREQEHTPWEK